MVPSIRVTNQRSVHPERCDLPDARGYGDKDWAPVEPAWRQLSSPARRFLKFLSALRTERIPEVFLLRLMTATKMWGPSGEIESIRTPLVDPIVWDLVHRTAFDFVQLYINMGLVRDTWGDFGRRVFTVSPKLQAVLVEQTEPFIPDMEWVRLVLVCHAFPGRWEEQW